MRIYADTSVFDGVFDKEFCNPSKQFFQEIDSGRFILVTSAIVAAENEPAPEAVKNFFTEYTKYQKLFILLKKLFFTATVS